MPREYQMRRTELVGMSVIQDLIEATLWTTWVANEKTAGLILIAEPESGKTELMKKYRKNDGVNVRRTTTAYGIIQDILSGRLKVLDEEGKRTLGHILTYDLTDVFAYKHETVNKTISLFNALLEEGLSPQSAYWIKSSELENYEGVTAGIIAGVVPFGFFTKAGSVRSNILKGGLLTRFPVARFTTTTAQLRRVFNSIIEGKYRKGQGFVDTIELDFPEESVDVRMLRKHLVQVEDLAKDVAYGTALDLKGVYEPKGLRMNKAFISLAKAIALRDGRDYTAQGDINRLKYLSNWMNLKKNPLTLKYPRDFRRLD